jgi:transcriptional antiterminator RfaH
MAALETTDLRQTLHRCAAAVTAGQWRVLWTKPRQEKAVARYLEAAGSHHYLPLVPKVSYVRQRKVTSWLPLFPSYVFIAGEIEEAYAAISTKRVVQVLEVPNQDQFEDEIDQIRLALEQGGELEMYPFAVVGRRCRVCRGPFLGVEGVITDRLGPSRLCLQVAILGQAAALEVDADLLEPAD